MNLPSPSIHYLEIVTRDVEAARLGAQILLNYMDIPGWGKISIYEIGGIQQGLWQVA